jgi:alanine-synthesizing transaminase
MFSSRTSWDRTENPLSAAVAEARAAGRPLIDLTESNPTRCEIADLGRAIATLGDPRGAAYEPNPLGHPAARAAVAGYYAAKGVAVDPGRIVLSASTSESYAWLFGLLADPGDRILVPRPSYPLLPWIGSSQNVQLAAYRLDCDRGFAIDFADLERSINERTRAIVAVHPNNPTGSFVRKDEAAHLAEIAADRDLALIVDEVFADYGHASLPHDAAPTFARTEGALTFVLSGISKVLILPQCKLAWTVVAGPAGAAAEAIARIELVADTFLSVATPVQLALADLLSSQPATVAAVRSRLAENLRALDLALAGARGAPCARRLPAQGGWYAVLEVPGAGDEDGLAEALVRQDGVIVHPGYFFDFDRDGFLVLSLLLQPAAFREGVARLMRRIAQKQAR